MVCASRPSGDSLNVKVLTRQGSAAFAEVEAMGFTPNATLINDIDPAATVLAIGNGQDLESVGLDKLAYLDDEPPDTPLSEPMVQDFELDGMPFHSFTVEFRQGVPLPSGWADLGAIGGPVSVQGRTKAEAMRTAMAAAPDRATVPNVLLSVRRA